MPYIHQIHTRVPEQHYTQEFAREFMKEHVAERDAFKRIIHRVYSMSAIEKRHSVITEFGAEADSGIFFDKEQNRFLNPTTGERNSRYTEEARKLYTQTAAETLEKSDFSGDDITHVITVSCTGFFAPGPDFYIVRELGLSPETRRYHLGFMGCYAAFPAMRMAESICAENPDAVVLIVCLELCTLHLQHKTDTDALISASVFADGAAGLIISEKRPSASAPALRIGGLHTTLTPEGEKDMAWTIGDSGFDMVLSTYVPDIIESNLSKLLNPVLGEGFSPDDFGYWAIHPGGRAILDKAENALSLNPKQIAPSRETLRNFGNMSSATVLFVLEQIMYHFPHRDKPVVAMAFGPGLTVETGTFELLKPAETSESETTEHAAFPS